MTNWQILLGDQKLTEDTIESHKNEILASNAADGGATCEILSSYQTLSENFISRHQNSLIDWIAVSYHQNLSEDFIKEFQDKVDWRWISRRQTLSEEFKNQFRHRFNETLNNRPDSCHG